MKWLVASDIHGSAEFCEKLVRSYKEEKAEKLILLGDILYHGPRNNLPSEYAPKSVVSMLNELKDEILCVRGNCDAEVDQMVLDFPIMAEYALLPLGNSTVFITHGHKFNTQNPPPLSRGDILLHGHTHVPKCEEFGDGFVYCNPGSTSIPKENSAHGYMLLSNDKLEWKTFSGDVYMTYNL
ncbi:MAG: phosphodiesterase [Oscillospiraceae bacterium]|nr:phosphodiesterase [Oscillospiraceae bacterium]